MDKGMGRRTAVPTAAPGKAVVSSQHEFEGVVRNGVIELRSGSLPEGTAVDIRVKKH
jgi:hypothetical protein